jgi:hypothetical protein
MASRTVNLVMDQGADFYYSSKIYEDPSDITEISISTSNDHANASMRKSYYHANSTANFSVYLTATEVSIHLNAANTATITPGRYVYDVEFFDADGNPVDGSVAADPANWVAGRRIRVLEGIVTVNPEATK